MSLLLISNVPLQKHTNSDLKAYAGNIQPYLQETKSNIGEFVERKGQIAGEVRIVRGWHAIGRNVSPSACHFHLLLTHQ